MAGRVKDWLRIPVVGVHVTLVSHVTFGCRVENHTKSQNKKSVAVPNARENFVPFSVVTQVTDTTDFPFSRPPGPVIPQESFFPNCYSSQLTRLLVTVRKMIFVGPPGSRENVVRQNVCN